MQEQPLQIGSGQAQDFYSLSQPIMDAEPLIKNAHSATHMQIIGNQWLALAIEEQINVYSLELISKWQAPLIRVVSLPPIFQPTPKQHFHDPISRIFADQHHPDLTSVIFGEHRNLSSHALLSAQNTARRLTFFNNSKISVKRMTVAESGQALLLLSDGRAALLSSILKEEVTIDVNLTSLAEQPVRGVAFDRKSICAVLSERVILADKQHHSHSVHNVKVLQGSIHEVFLKEEDESWKMYVIGSQVAEMWTIGKKKVVLQRALPIGQHISQAIRCHDEFFLVTASHLFKVDPSLQSSKITTWEHPVHLIAADEFCNCTPRVLNTRSQMLWLVATTTNGVAFGLTIRRGGNYKQGRLIILEPDLGCYLKQLLSNIQQNRTVNMHDSIFISRHKNIQQRQLLQQFNSQNWTGGQIQGIQLTEQQYWTASINIGHAFAGKQSARQKLITKVLHIRHPGVKKTQLSLRCCFSGRELMDQQLVHCPYCDLYGQRGKGERCVACYRTMHTYPH